MAKIKKEYKKDKEQTVTFTFRLPISVANWWNEKIEKCASTPAFKMDSYP